MKNVSLAVVLVLTTVHGVAFGNNSLPRLATVRIKHFAAPGSVLLLNRSVALLSPKALEETSYYKLYKKKLRNSASMAAVSSAAITGAALHTLSANPSKFFDDFHISVLVAGGVILGGFLAIKTVTSSLELYKIKEKLKTITKATENENNIVIYESDGVHRIGILTHADEELVVVDAQGNKKAIDPKHYMQLVAIRDGLPHGSFINWVLSNKPMSNAISADFADKYRGATLAFTYKEKNHLSTVDEVRFADDGRGELDILTASGEELIITRGKRGKPVVIDSNTGEMTKEKFRGVLFLP